MTTATIFLDQPAVQEQLVQESQQAGPVSHQEMRDLLGKLLTAPFTLEMSVPADPQRDADIRMSAYITQNAHRDAMMRHAMTLITNRASLVIGSDQLAIHWPHGVEEFSIEASDPNEKVERAVIWAGSFISAFMRGSTREDARRVASVELENKS